jgi:hypothetical protein
MTTIASSQLSETLQVLVDARLDTIDRMLLGRVNRQDRLAIVREVESQIFDLLPGRDPEALDRDDVLAVLARLDPPEAYLPDESTGERAPTRMPTAPRASRPSSEPNHWVVLSSGVLGIVSVIMVFLSILIVFTASDVGSGLFAYLVMLGPVFLTFVIGLLAVIFAARVRLRGGWAITGLVTGILSMLISGFGGLLLLAGG